METALQESSYQYQSFEKLNLTGEGIQQKIFEECIFTNCDFSGCSFPKTRFVDCFFIDCNLSMVKFRNTGLQNISFRECKMLGADFSESEPFLFEVKFESCVLDFASFAERKMPNTLFIDSTLKNSVFLKTMLNDALFQNCDLSDAVFRDTVLSGADLTSSRNYDIDPELNNIRKARFSLYGLPGLLSKYNIHIE
jgi:fluoroquinolone resistance protein